MTISSNDVTSADAVEASYSFAEMDLQPELLAHLAQLGFTTPTAIQKDAIPVVLTGQDVIGVAQTGTGKTLAFGLPIVQRHLTSKYCGRSLIILPTRELAIQVEETLHKISEVFGVRTALLIGGAPMKPQQADLRLNPDVIVGTPGRIIDHLQSGGIDLRTVDTLVLDEADRMLDMGFEPQIQQILRGVPPERQTLLFSATMPKPIVHIANKYMYEPQRVEVAQSGTTAKDISQELFIVPQEEKNNLLAKVLLEYEGTVLVFARTRLRAANIARFVKRANHSAAEIHSDRNLVQRRAALDGFKSGRYRVLIATDIAARGIDVSDIELVVNYDLPDNAEDYVHRIGRTGRAGKSGHAISFAAPNQKADVREIEKLIRTSLPVSERSSAGLKTRPAQNRSARSRRPGRKPIDARTSGKQSGKVIAKRNLSSMRRGRTFSQMKEKQAG